MDGIPSCCPNHPKEQILKRRFHLLHMPCLRVIICMVKCSTRLMRSAQVLTAGEMAIFPPAGVPAGEIGAWRLSFTWKSFNASETNVIQHAKTMVIIRPSPRDFALTQCIVLVRVFYSGLQLKNGISQKFIFGERVSCEKS